MQLTLAQTPPAAVSSDTTLHGRLAAKIGEIAVEIGVGTTSTMSQSLGLIIGTLPIMHAGEVCTCYSMESPILRGHIRLALYNKVSTFYCILGCHLY
jgi:hypothetical protein